MEPLELIALEFPGNRFSGEILPALQAVVDKGIIHIIDLAFVKKAADGTVTALELQDLPGEEARVFDPVAADVAGLLSATDIAHVGAGLSANSSAAVLLFEHRWVGDVRAAVLRANGRMVLRESIPAAVAEAAAAAAAEDAAMAATAAGA